MTADRLEKCIGRHVGYLRLTTANRMAEEKGNLCLRTLLSRYRPLSRLTVDRHCRLRSFGAVALLTTALRHPASQADRFWLEIRADDLREALFRKVLIRLMPNRLSRQRKIWQ